MEISFRKHAGYDPLGDCGKGKCPICARNQAVSMASQTLKGTEFQSDAVAPFVGRFGYPNVNVGILAPAAPEDESWHYDAPKYWAYKDMAIPEIVNFRSSLINSRHNLNIKKQDKLLELSQEAALASRPVDVEISLAKAPSYRMLTDSVMAPTGPQADLRKAHLTSNPHIHTKVQRAFGDYDLRAQDAIIRLYDEKFDENFLSRILSVGTLGIRKNRRLVPTRWSITATDDIIGKNLVKEVQDYPEIGYKAYFGGYLGNYYLILTFPEVWGYELFETYVPRNVPAQAELNFMTDHETYRGRKDYAEETSGGYYTVRLAILEHFRKLRRRGTAIALRFITDEYSMPLGVWVTREATRNAMDSKPLEFSSRELLLDYARKLARKKFGWDPDSLLRRSILLRQMRTQRKLASFFSME